MFLPWLCLTALAAVGADSGASLRGAVEALQRRQRNHARGPLAPPPDYDALYEFIPPSGYPEPDYVEVENLEDQPSPKYIVKFLEENDHAPENYEYKIIKKKNSRSEGIPRKESPFRERSQHSDNDMLRELFADRSEVEDGRKNEVFQDKIENDAEYALLLSQLWSKYKNNKSHGSHESAPQGVVKLYKDKIIKKRYPGNWGPIAFKRKRSSDLGTDHPLLGDLDAETKDPVTLDPTYDTSNDDKDDWREEYAIAFQPLDDEPLNELGTDDQYSYNVEKRFPVAKRSSGPYDFNNPKKRFVLDQKLKGKSFRSSSGTDPRIIKDLSKIFGDIDIKNPVKRNADDSEHTHDSKPPPVLNRQNKTNEHENSTKLDEESHEHHGHGLHHPGISGNAAEHTHGHNHDHSHDHTPIQKHDLGHDHTHQEKQKVVRKKSIDWSDYFGIDKRGKKFISDVDQNRLRKQYFDTFNKEVVYPVNSFRKHSYVKRNYIETKSNENTGSQEDTHVETTHNEEKQDTAKENDAKLDSIDKKLRNMEGMLVDDALRYSEVDEEMDSKEEQEMKEKLLSRLAAAYSLEKMRKALREFKQSLQTQRTSESSSETTSTDESKVKRVAIKKEKVDIMSNEIPPFKAGEQKYDFEEEQGAGHYLNGKTEQHFSEGYMGGSGRHRTPVMETGGAAGSCPVLSKIVQRCRSVDLLAGDRGQLFLPLCSLHQICYLCAEAPPTTCDLVFLSEADTTCEGDMGCQRAARSTLMALRELHDNLADEMDGECEASPCLSATLKLNSGWQKALQR